jgi:molybdenum cofactor guanylyltransferase
MAPRPHPVGAILLCGGASRRMGWDKTRLRVDGTLVVARTGRLLSRVADARVEVGPGLTGLACAREDPPGEGPLAAVGAGWAALDGGGLAGALVVAGDLPFVSAPLLELLLEAGSAGSVVPVVDGRDQPLCAYWCRRDLDEVRGLLSRGERSLRFLAHRVDVTYLDEAAWGRVASARDFADVDTPGDLERLGLAPPSDP